MIYWYLSANIKVRYRPDFAFFTENAPIWPRQGSKWGMYLHTWVCIHTFSRNWVCKRYVFDRKGM